MRTTGTKFMATVAPFKLKRLYGLRILSRLATWKMGGNHEIDSVCNLMRLAYVESTNFMTCHNQLPQFYILYIWWYSRFTSSSPLVPCSAQPVASPVLKRVSFTTTNFSMFIYFVSGLPAIWWQFWFHQVLLWRPTRRPSCQPWTRSRNSQPEKVQKIHQSVSATVGTDLHSQCAEGTDATSFVVGRRAYEPLPIDIYIYICIFTFFLVHISIFAYL